MCGIHGVINKSGIALASLSSFMSQGFLANSLRGTDSSGVFQIDKQSRKFMHKSMISGYNFCETKIATRFCTDVATSPITVGHVRAATHGKVTAENAHPFLVERPGGKSCIIGVHNGTITNWRSHKDSTAYDVDSEWALTQIAKDGVDALELMSGSYCFVWWDEDKPGKLFMVRNEDRPMHLLLNAAKSAAMFASEAGMLAWLAERNKIETDDMIYSLEPHKLYTFDVEKTGSPITWTKANAPKYKAPSYNTHNNSGRGRWNHQLGRWEDPPGVSSFGSVGNGSTNNVSSSASGGSTVGNDPNFPPAAASFCERFKRAVAQNRTERFSDELNTESGVQPGEAGAADHKPKNKKERRLARKQQLKLGSKKDSKSDLPSDTRRGGVEFDANGEAIAPSHWFSTGTATAAEQQSAKSLGVMGSIQYFKGIAYEPSTCELFGEFEVWDVASRSKVKYEAVLRGLSGHAALDKWVDSGGDWACIIGRYEDKAMRQYVFVVSGLTDAGKKQMYDRAA